MVLEDRHENSPLPKSLLSAVFEEVSPFHSSISLALVDLKIGVLWGKGAWDFERSRGLSADGCDLLIYMTGPHPMALEEEFWWVRTYENVVPSLKIRYVDGAWDISAAGPDGMPRESVRVTQYQGTIIEVDLGGTKQARRSRPFLLDKGVPM